MVPPTAADQAVATVRRFRLLADAAGATEVLAKATSAIRRAANGGELVDRIRAETGVHVEVIGGLEEARLIFGAVRASVVLDPAPALCFDLGGGSLEVMVGDASSLMWATSVPLGVARLTADFVHSDPISKSDRRALRDHIAEVLAPVVAEVETFEPKLAVGSSGTLENLAEMVAARRDEDTPATLNQLTITRQEFLELHKDLLASKATERLRIDGLDARRVDLIVAGSMVLATAMELFGFDQLTISEWALREGIVLDAVGRHDPDDWSDDPHAIRGNAVVGLARALQLGRGARRARSSKLSLDLFDATAPLHRPRRRRPRAARVRRPAPRHRRARRQQRAPQARRVPRAQRAAARLRARSRSRCWPRSCAGTDAASRASSDEFPLLDAEAIDRVRALAAILRVADGLDRSRNQNVYGVDAMITPSLVLLRVRALDDAELEIWGARRKRALLEKVLDRELELTTHPSMG